MSTGIEGFNSLQELAKAQAKINKLRESLGDLYQALLEGKLIIVKDEKEVKKDG